MSMNTLTIPAASIRPDDILCNATGAPCARVADVIGAEESCVWVSAYSLDGDVWFPVSFDVGEETTVMREELAVTGGTPVDFSAVCEGDRLSFITTENGYGGRGVYTRTGRVRRVTERTVLVDCDDSSRAMLRRADWNARGVQRETLATTGRPSRAPLQAAAITAGAATAVALAVVLSTSTDHPTPTPTTTPHFSRSSSGIEPYRPIPEPRTTSHTSRMRERKALTEREHIAFPSTSPATPHPISTPPADIRISFYRDCTGHAQQCIDAGALTMYAGRILAGHNYNGYQWLSRVPVNRTVHVIHGPLAGTYQVYGHLRIGRQGGAIPTFPGSPDLILQTCEGSGTGFSLLRRA
ncbi:hypothetical protein [Streptomyces sp. NPDC056061]|uniref:hypothetical protein n=1 Tax=Streptomyces sp. NPDC056061 TaxID=3345700 RepID=UPI0035DC2EB7